MQVIQDLNKTRHFAGKNKTWKTGNEYLVFCHGERAKLTRRSHTFYNLKVNFSLYQILLS